MRVLAKRDLALVLSIGLIVPVCSRAQQQTETTSAIKASIAGETSVPKASSNAVSDAPQKGFPLSVSLPKQLADVASVEAVLIPASVAERIFGKEIAHNYAVIELTVSNTDPNASLVLQSVFLDYSQWILSGLPMRADQQVELQSGLTGNQKASKPWQVASVESRLVRGELLDAQQWTNRNWTIRGLTALGSVGAGFVFPFSGDVAKGVAAYNGVLVPGAATLWPDATVGQLNRISDFGFQTNKLVPKEASDIVVAFFPIERFLTPSFKKEFIHNPAGFFVPGEMLADPRMAPQILPLLVPLISAIEGASVTSDVAKTKIVQSLLMDCSTKETGQAQSANTAFALAGTPNGCRIQTLINQISLNSIRLVIGGVMSVNVASVPPSIFEVDFDNDGPDIWSKPGIKTGTILGTYLSGGNPIIVDDQGKAIDGLTIKGVTQGSDDRELHFEITVAKCIPPSTKVRFQVNKPSDAELAQGAGAESAGIKQKPATKGSGVSSMLFDYSLSGYTCTPPDAAAGEDGTAEHGARDAAEKPATASPAIPPNHPAPVTPAAKPLKKKKVSTHQ
jgi:hypothetical protein